MRPVVINAGAIVHYGETKALEASDLPGAQVEVDRMNLVAGGNYVQILNEDDEVLSHRTLGTDYAQWR